MIIYPAIDIRGGKCVRLFQGRADQQTDYFDDPVEPARLWQKAGAEWVHVVDLDGAFEGVPQNLDIVKHIAALGLKVQLGGGIRDRATAEKVLAAGVQRFVVGTKACESPQFVAEMAEVFGPSLVVGIDAKDGMAAVRGWVEASKHRALDLAKEMADLGVRRVVYTDIDTDGALGGPNLKAQEEMCRAVDLQVIASGGVGSVEDLENLRELSRTYPHLEGVIVGKALYDGRIEAGELNLKSF
ncbi:MAG: 1-(5-phosphoribosyl)-5-[(5-phosphoribosylamino)methylideneamino]imidazole-4-carboxamide isomerase [Opitutales bacterium]|nr:1-(5-phosphoribosyl)-5-[(5-phosphoribosylamino)methylideneamino]imidazole-4-carboxamide isomerase [Opitutales bacterium]